MSKGRALGSGQSGRARDIAYLSGRRWGAKAHGEPLGGTWRPRVASVHPKLSCATERVPPGSVYRAMRAAGRLRAKAGQQRACLSVYAGSRPEPCSGSGPVSSLGHRLARAQESLLPRTCAGP